MQPHAPLLPQRATEVPWSMRRALSVSIVSQNHVSCLHVGFRLARHQRGRVQSKNLAALSNYAIELTPRPT